MATTCPGAGRPGRSVLAQGTAGSIRPSEVAPSSARHRPFRKLRVRQQGEAAAALQRLVVGRGLHDSQAYNRRLAN
jgi:hypothetical protein